MPTVLCVASNWPGRSSQAESPSQPYFGLSFSSLSTPPQSNHLENVRLNTALLEGLSVVTP